MRNLRREPLLHFVLLGAGLFLAHGLVGERSSGEPREIVVAQGKVEQLVTGFARTWQRPPTGEELAGLIRDHVHEEVAAREAMALGLDRDDTIVRRRLRQKMEFISEDVAAQAEPTDEDLRAYLVQHPGAFRTERRFTFTQVFLDPARRRDQLARDGAQFLARLRQAGATADVSSLGDSVLLAARFEGVSAGEVTRQFGEKFAAALADLPLGQWEGPVESGYGVHLVLVSERTEGQVPALEGVRDAVRREWTNARRGEARERFYAALLARYTVTVEEPAPGEGWLAQVRQAATNP